MYSKAANERFIGRVIHALLHYCESEATLPTTTGNLPASMYAETDSLVPGVPPIQEAQFQIRMMGRRIKKMKVKTLTCPIRPARHRHRAANLLRWTTNFLEPAASCWSGGTFVRAGGKLVGAAGKLIGATGKFEKEREERKRSEREGGREKERRALVTAN